LNNYSNELDEELLSIGSYDDFPGFYYSFPQMLPWIGKEYYNKNHRKLILIGESHYLPKNVDPELLDPKTWYDENHSEFYGEGDEEEEYTNTRKIVGSGKWPSRAHSIYRESEKVLRNVAHERNINLVCSNYLELVSYYNFFLRPASKGLSIKSSLKNKDEKIAIDTFKELIGILKPDYVFFLSRLAFVTYSKFASTFDHSIKVDYSSHPCCSWWNRKHLIYNGEIITGKEKFKRFISDNNFFIPN